MVLASEPALDTAPPWAMETTLAIAAANTTQFAGFIASTFATPVGNTGTLVLASSMSDQDHLAKAAG